jgi:hypothetical protein
MSSHFSRGLGDDAATRHRTPVPEPSTLAPLGAGVLSLCALGWRRSARSQTSMKSHSPTLEPSGGVR